MACTSTGAGDNGGTAFEPRGFSGSRNRQNASTGNRFGHLRSNTLCRSETLRTYSLLAWGSQAEESRAKTAVGCAPDAENGFAVVWLEWEKSQVWTKPCQKEQHASIDVTLAQLHYAVILIAPKDSSREECLSHKNTGVSCFRLGKAAERQSAPRERLC